MIMGKRLSYTPETIERALRNQQAAGLIGGIVADGDRRVVTLASGDLFELRTLREAYVFLRGLASAQDAYRRNNPTIPDPKPPVTRDQVTAWRDAGLDGMGQPLSNEHGHVSLAGTWVPTA